MEKVLASEVKPGQQFSSTLNNPFGDGFPALMLDQKQALRMMHKKKAPHGENVLYYVFLPHGELSWTSANSEVYVKPN